MTRYTMTTVRCATRVTTQPWDGELEISPNAFDLESESIHINVKKSFNNLTNVMHKGTFGHSTKTLLSHKTLTIFL